MQLMPYLVMAAVALAAAVLALLLWREVRLRKALQVLLAKLFTLWRNQHGNYPAKHPSDADRQCRDDRLR